MGETENKEDEAKSVEEAKKVEGVRAALSLSLASSSFSILLLPSFSSSCLHLIERT